jgi:pyruvate kinase
MSHEQTSARAERLISIISDLRERALALEHQFGSTNHTIDPDYQTSARNLLHYLALRQVDLRAVQSELSALGLTSLSGSESHALSSLNAVLHALHCLADRSWDPASADAAPVDIRTGPMMLDHHSELLLGSPAGKRSVRIMVTMPSEAAWDYELVRNLLAAGMDVMRINAAHDNAEAWLGMVNNLRRAERELGRSAKIYADLAGPKLRTGAIEPVGHIVKIRPRRDRRGQVTEPASVWLTPSDRPEPAPANVSAALPVDRGFLEALEPGSTIRFDDTRGRHRAFAVVETTGASRLAETDRTAYVEEGHVLQLVTGEDVSAQGHVGVLPEVIEPIELVVGDTLVLTREVIPGQPASPGCDGQPATPAHIPCSLEEAFTMVKPGEIIRFDDGKIGGRVVSATNAEIVVRITYTGPRAAKLRPEKGINLPDTDLAISALTEKDLQDLEFLVKHVDMVGLSFVRTPEDVLELEQHLQRLGGSQIGVVLKVENRQAFDNLPRLLLAAMQSPPVGVMVARGDLAVEVGFERLAEVQEEILWLCEAAHVPVIWATQVLEGLAKTGSPTRAEVSDAVMSGRAECVMLNKGPFIVEAVRFLNGVLERMHAHQHKRRSMLRKLSVSEQL